MQPMILRVWSHGRPGVSVEARVMVAISLLLAMVIAGCSRTDAPTVQSGQSDLRMVCSMLGLGFRVGQELPPPELAITNATNQHVDLIGPTLTVMHCLLRQPDGTLVELHLAMPTGRNPSDMPRTRLLPGASIGFTPTGIWHYVDRAGYEPYVFELEGTYEIHCEYGPIRSNTVALEVDARPPQVR